MWCEDCGTKYSNGLCPNCHEEAFIRHTQCDDDRSQFSDDFNAQADDQESRAELVVRMEERR